MPSDRYVTVSVRPGIKQDLKDYKYKNETYSALFARLLEGNSPVKAHIETILRRQQQLYDLQAAIAEEVGVDTEQLPELEDPDDVIEELGVAFPGE